MYLTNNLINWTDWLNDFCVLRVTEWFLVWPPIYSVFSTLWHLFCIDSFHMVHNQAKWFKYILFPNSWKAWSNLHICKRGPIKSVLFICPSVCLSACLSVCLSVTFLSGSTQWFSLIFCMGIFLYVYTKTWLNQILEICICFLDNWVKKTNLDKKWNIWDFNRDSITFCALNDTPQLAIWFCKNSMSGEHLVLSL